MNRRQRIAFAPDDWRGRHIVICNWRDLSHPNAGGAELYCERIAARFFELGARVTILAARYPGCRNRTNTAFGSIRRVGGPLSVYPMALLWLVLRRASIDAVIDSQNGIPFFAPLALRRETPVTLLIHHVHQQQFALYFPPWLAFIGRLLENQVSAKVYGRSAVCVVSPSSRTDVRKKLSFEGPVYVTPCGQDLPLDRPAHKTTEPSLIYVGRLVRQKRLDLLVAQMPAVLDRFANAHLHIVGDGEEQQALKEQAIKLGLDPHVTFHGRVPDHRRDELLASSWLFVSPSRAEGWGMSVMEAAAHGVPAVSYRVAGLQDAILENETGWLVEEGTSLAPAICDALNELNSERREEIAEACRGRARRFSWSATAERLLGVLASERERLVHPLFDRRQTSDAATVATVSRSAFSIELLQGLRRQDQARFGTNEVDLLLVGTDEEGAMRAFRRLGLPLEHLRGLRVARSSDLIGWDVDAASSWLGALSSPDELEDDPFYMLQESRRRLRGSRLRRLQPL
jgi:glycosyltransferase involved in cell wall biosynthesis